MNKELLRMEHIVTYRGSRKVLNNAKLNLFEGEIIGITGVNNSGKSLLVGGIAGTSPISSGNIYISEAIASINSIEDGRKAGVYYFSRNSSLITDFTIWENFLLGPANGQTIIHTQDSETQCHQILELLGIQVNIHEQICSLTPKERLLVEMARAVYYDAQIFIMDDVLSTLSATALTEFEEIFQMLCSLHIGIILIESGVRRLKHYCHRLFIMREGQTVAELDSKTMDENLVISLMLGTQSFSEDKSSALSPQFFSKVLLEMNNVCSKHILSNLSLQIFQGETAGILNIGKHSGSAIHNLLQGLESPDEGTISYQNSPIRLKNIEHAVKAGIVSFTGQDEIVPNLTLEENIMLPALKCKSKFAGIMNLPELKYTAKELISRYIVDYEGIYIPENKIEQDRILRWKIGFCRMLSTNPKLAVILNPTQTIDITSKELLYQDIRSLNNYGVTVLTISSDIRELFAICDRIMVINQGTIEATVHNNEVGREQLLYLYGQYLKLM